MADFGSGHVSRRSLQAKTEGYSVFETADAPQEVPLGCIVRYSEDFKEAKTQTGADGTSRIPSGKMLFLDGH